MEYRITDLTDLAAAFRLMADHERGQFVGAAKFRQREQEVRAKAYERCATIVEETILVAGKEN
jgi:hypothetical protein